MTVQDFDGGIHKDTNVYGANVYLGKGQGCATIWFKTVAAARKALKKNGIITGEDLYDCTKCDCNYSISEELSGKYPEHACSKEKYVNQFNK